MKKFWDERAKKKISPISMGNLEENKILLKKKVNLEEKKINKFLKGIKIKKILDLGCGTGTWSLFFCKNLNLNKIYSVDYSKNMLKVARKFATKFPNKISFFNSPAENFYKKKKFDLIWISGLLIYLTNKKVEKLLNHCRKMLDKNGIIIIRDATAKNKELILKKKFSEELNAYYSAKYRTRSQYEKLFSKYFSIIQDENMFPKNSSLNKRKETILRIYKLKKNEKI